ncbi:hypothetical protein ACVWWR_003709 [Bradyrhizobium sp. LM3.2]
MSEISAFAAPPIKLAASASVHFKFFIVPSPVVFIVFNASSVRPA